MSAKDYKCPTGPEFAEMTRSDLYGHCQDAEALIQELRTKLSAAEKQLDEALLALERARQVFAAENDARAKDRAKLIRQARLEGMEAAFQWLAENGQIYPIGEESAASIFSSSFPEQGDERKS